MKHVLAYRQVTCGLDATIGHTNRQVMRARTGTPGRHTAFRDWNVSPGHLDVSTKSERIVETSHRYSEPAEDHGFFHDTVFRSQTEKPSSSIPDCAQPLVNKTRQYCWAEQAKESPRRSMLETDNILVTAEALLETDTKIINLLWDLEMKDTLLKIRSKDQVPKTTRRVSGQEREKRTSVETCALPEFDDQGAIKNTHKVPTISPRTAPTSASEIYTLLNARSKKRDQLLSRSSLQRSTIHSLDHESQGRCNKTMPDSGR